MTLDGPVPHLKANPGFFDAANATHAIVVAAWNVAIFGGAVVGGVILETARAVRLP